MKIEICADAAAAASRAAGLILESIAQAITARGVAAIAVSGGTTPTAMLGELAASSVDWHRVHVFQVDERLVPDDDERRNVRLVREAFAYADLPDANLHAVPAGSAAPQASADRYARELRAVAGTPPVLDVVHLGLGEDGHTASLFPGDRAVDDEGDVALSGEHGGMRRITLTLATINRARTRIWLVNGARKREVVGRMLEPGSHLVANRVQAGNSVLVLDVDASAVSP
jgi:6-phosphogluconolactonase